MARRIDDVACLLHPDERHEELRSLHCLGYCERPETEADQEAIGYIYAFPDGAPGEPFSLSPKIEHPSDSPPSSSQRLSLVHPIAKALSLLHLLGWLHKSFHIQNILFFACSLSEVDLASPYLTGFDFSRVEVDTFTEIPDKAHLHNLYRHPQAQGVPLETIAIDAEVSITPRQSFMKIHDIYGLGVTMLEIGLWESISAVKDRALKDEDYVDTAVHFHDWMLTREVPEMQDSIGDAYAVVTEKCPLGDFDSKVSVDVAFSLDIVPNLAPYCQDPPQVGDYSEQSHWECPRPRSRCAHFIL